MPDTAAAGIALFDMDGTLLPWDCQLLFREHVIRAQPYRYYSVPVFLLALPFAKLLGTETMKRIFHCFLWKMSATDLKQLSRSFAESLLPMLYPELISALKKHQAAGDLTILTSASPECYVAEVGATLGFDHSLGTVLNNRRFFPDLTNHKGTNKVIRIRKILSMNLFEGEVLKNSHAYTDSTADLPLLEICQSATLVNPGKNLTQIGKSKQWEILRPTRPWKSQVEKSLRVVRLLLGLP